MSSLSICRIFAPSVVFMSCHFCHCTVLSCLVEYWFSFLILSRGMGTGAGISSWTLCPFGLGCIYQHTAMIPPMCDFFVFFFSRRVFYAVRASQGFEVFHLSFY